MIIVSGIETGCEKEIEGLAHGLSFVLWEMAARTPLAAESLGVNIGLGGCGVREGAHG